MRRNFPQTVAEPVRHIDCHLGMGKSTRDWADVMADEERPNSEQ
jgi:hypothetical protein